MQKRYVSRQLFLIGHQIFSISYLCLMAVKGYYIAEENTVHFCLLTLLFADAAYISYKNIKNSFLLNHFTCLLLLLGWQQLLFLYETHMVSAAIAAALLPVCFYQTVYFMQLFVFQSSAYRFQKPFLIMSASTCIAATIGFSVSQRAFAIIYGIQVFLSFLAMAALVPFHFKRIGFVLRSQKKQFLFSAVFVLLPFICYVIAFKRQPEFLSGMGSCLVVMLVSVSVHSIVFRYHPQQEHFSVLKPGEFAFLAFVGILGLSLTAVVFNLPLTAVFVCLYIVLLLILVFNLLLYRRITAHREDFENSVNRRHFYFCSLEQIKREEALKKEFSNYLHDHILQDLLSVKNLLGKAGEPKVRQMLHDILGGLTSSLRQQMQTYHPTLLKGLTYKGNIQNLLDTLTQKSSVRISLDCRDSLFLVEPYTLLVYRMIQELVTNALKHADAGMIKVVLVQENADITLKISDNGKGFQSPDDTHTYSSHRGLESVREQVSLLDGSMIIHSAPGAGTEITITMPMKGDDSYENFIGR